MGAKPPSILKLVFQKAVVVYTAIECFVIAGISALGIKGWPLRVLRGGGWNNNGHNCRSAARINNDPNNENHNVGLRVVSTSERQSILVRIRIEYTGVQSRS